MRRIVTNVLLALVSAGVALVAAELVLRARWNPAYTLPAHVHSRTTTREYDAEIETNRAGFRDGDHHWDSSVGYVFARVAVIGDSFVFGSGVNDSDRMTSWLQRLLSQDRAIADVYNFGVPGTGPVNALNLWRHHASKVHPDVVVLALYAGNDASDALRESRSSRPRSVMLTRTKFLLKHQLAVWRHDSHAEIDTARTAGKPPALGWNAFGFDNPAGMDALLAAARQRGVPEDSVRARLAAIPDSLVADARAFRSNPFNLAEAVLDPDGLRHNLLLDTPDMEKGWLVLESALRKLKEETAAADCRLLLVAIPAAVQVDSTYWWLKYLGVRLDERVLSDTEFQNRLASFAGQEGLSYIDLLPVMRAHPELRFYYEQDGHWNSAGQLEAAKAIRERILEWLPVAKPGAPQG